MSEKDDWLQGVIGNHGQDCGNCGCWRILKTERQADGSPWHNSVAAGSPRIIEECPDCRDEAYDIYEVADDGP